MREVDWRERQRLHEERVEPWVAPRLARRKRGQSQATEDFLFEYYPYSVGRLRTWHPGYGEVLEGDARDFLEHPAYVTTERGVTASLDWLDEQRRSRLDLAIRILDGTAVREPVLGCFALHEWAMVYGLEQDEVRHQSLPLRLTPDEIRGTVDAISLRCTHIDAFRFFTDEAKPLNSLEPTRATQPDLEQPGCLHASMDLYKYAMWFQPLVPGELVADLFENARTARELDMQASPYDVTELGLETIPVETPEGRQTYLARQRDLIAATEPLRAQLSEHLHVLRDS
jgi:hypothetical protein